MAHIEIERKFLVKGEFKHLAYDCTHIEQGYFATEPGKTVRVRIRGDKGYLTIKGPSGKDGLGRYEFETEDYISREDFIYRRCRERDSARINGRIPDSCEPLAHHFLP